MEDENVWVSNGRIWIKTPDNKYKKRHKAKNIGDNRG